jgi:hypothetical protein
MMSEPVTKDFLAGMVFGMFIMAAVVAAVVWAFH